MSFEKLFESLGDLPVAAIADDVTLSVYSGTVTTLSSATGSGKTLYQTANLADFLDEQVVVLVPRRFLAVNAAETIAELSGCEIGTAVGYAVGSQTGDRSCWTDDTKLLFATNGYALASGLVQRATTFVLDEVHETSLDLSIIRALLHRRMAQGESIKLLEMSATMDTRRQAAYWSGVADTKIFQIDGKTFDCDVRHAPAGRVENEVMNLIEEGRRGILVFRPGVGEVQDTAEEITRLAQAAEMQIEVAQIYGEMNYADRRQATAAPAEGKVKVLVGTNVIESGINFPWVDGGVTCGTGKENSVRLGTGATYLELVELPRWRLDQQEGRVKRFRPGVFVLCSPKSYGEREQASRPEIERLALTELVMHCASFGLRTHELNFDYAPDPAKVEEAELKLQRLGLIDEDCSLTDAGKAMTGVPVGPETSAMLWHARQLNCLGAMLPLAAIIEVGGLRKDFHYGHYLNDSSDYLDGLMAFREAYLSSGKERREVLERKNVGYKRFEAASNLLRDLERRLDTTFNFNIDGRLQELRQCILAGSLDKLFASAFRGDVVSVKNRLTSYRIGQGSAVSYLRMGSILAGDLRVITPKDKYKSPFTIVEKVTTFELSDLHAVAKLRPEVLVEERTFRDSMSTSVTGQQIEYVTQKLFGQYVIHQTTIVPPRESRLGLDFDSGEPSSLGDIFARARRW